MQLIHTQWLINKYHAFNKKLLTKELTKELLNA